MIEDIKGAVTFFPKNHKPFGVTGSELQPDVTSQACRAKTSQRRAAADE